MTAEEQTVVDGVRYALYALPLEQRALSGLTLEPTAARHKTDISVRIKRLLAPPHLVGQVVLRTAIGQQRTVGASGLVCQTSAGVMTDARSRPHVVHCPHHRLTAFQYFPYVSERKHALVYPVQMDNVSPLKLRQRRYVGAAIGNVYLKKMVL